MGSGVIFCVVARCRATSQWSVTIAARLQHAGAEVQSWRYELTSCSSLQRLGRGPDVDESAGACVVA
eukprot:1370998-Pleurochrysis_carterae.AAC.1